MPRRERKIGRARHEKLYCCIYIARPYPSHEIFKYAVAKYHIKDKRHHHDHAALSRLRYRDQHCGQQYPQYPRVAEFSYKTHYRIQRRCPDALDKIQNAEFKSHICCLLICTDPERHACVRRHGAQQTVPLPSMMPAISISDPASIL